MSQTQTGSPAIPIQITLNGKPHLIEVQSGPYLGEDDITRYEDVYART